jgi:hypothetical protein
MKHEDNEPYDLSRFKARTDDEIPVRPYKRHKPPKLRRSRKSLVPSEWKEEYVKVTPVWVEKLIGASGSTYHVAFCLLHLRFAAWNKGKPIPLSNVMVKGDGVSRRTKWRALRGLERRGLITIECHRRRSPHINLHHVRSKHVPKVAHD